MSFYHLNPARRGERMARQLERYEDYRVLRRLPRPDEVWLRTMPVATTTITIGIVDCETTGLDPTRDRMIELAIGTMTIDVVAGDVTAVEPPVAWLEDPGFELPIEIEQLTGITTEMVAGRAFPEAAITKVLKPVQVLVAHNAGFDCGFVTRRFPGLSLPWVCSMREVDWRGLGWTGGRSIESLLTGAGFFLPNAHRASADVWATTCLLAMSANDNRSIVANLIETAQRSTWRLFALRAPFDCKDMLKAAGYRWSPNRKAWWIEGDNERIGNERAWLEQLSELIKPRIEEITWLTRHAR